MTNDIEAQTTLIQNETDFQTYTSALKEIQPTPKQYPCRILTLKTTYRKSSPLGHIYFYLNDQNNWEPYTPDGDPLKPYLFKSAQIDPETETVLFKTPTEYFTHIKTLKYQTDYESPRTYPCRAHFKPVEEVRINDIIIAPGYFKQTFFYNIPVKCKCGQMVDSWQQYPWAP